LKIFLISVPPLTITATTTLKLQKVNKEIVKLIQQESSGLDQIF